MRKRIEMFIARWFLVISIEQAKDWGLNFSRNVYGDEITLLGGARSLWELDGNIYRVDSLYEEERCPICHYPTYGQGHRCILTQENL